MGNQSSRNTKCRYVDCKRNSVHDRLYCDDHLCPVYGLVAKCRNPIAADSISTCLQHTCGFKGCGRFTIDAFSDMFRYCEEHNFLINARSNKIN